jgi:hypothetical protein
MGVILFLTDRWTDGRRDATRIIFALFDRFAKAPERILEENVVRGLTHFTSFWVA